MIQFPDIANATSVQVIFAILSIFTLSTAFLTIYSKKPMHNAIYLVLCFSSISGHYLLLNSQFLAIVNLIVYIGAIMVLIVFTIMLMNLNNEDSVHKPRVTRLGAIVLFSIMCIVLLAMFVNSKPIADGSYEISGQDYQSINILGKILLNEYMVPFEFASVLLLVAMIGAVLLSKKEKVQK
jgi:NADH-quinone oxidoreductase subunit J